MYRRGEVAPLAITVRAAAITARDGRHTGGAWAGRGGASSTQTCTAVAAAATASTACPTPPQLWCAAPPAPLVDLDIHTHTHQVPPGHIWLEGDNLIVSRDSREYGPVPLALVRGRAVLQVIAWRAGWTDGWAQRGAAEGSTQAGRRACMRRGGRSCSGVGARERARCWC